MSLSPLLLRTGLGSARPQVLRSGPDRPRQRLSFTFHSVPDVPTHR